jgi:ribosomal protein S18 acetylase RimI-like enzyme
MLHAVNEFLHEYYMIVRRATLDDLNTLAVLFDEYRQIYTATSNLKRTTNFLQQRLENAETIIFVHIKNDELTGFVVLYHGFSTVKCSRNYVLDDVYIRPMYRRQGAARQLIDTAILFSQHQGADVLSVDILKSNAQAHQLYASMGFKAIEHLQHYERQLN